jgi:hypothetical protein
LCCVDSVVCLTAAFVFGQVANSHREQVRNIVGGITAHHRATLSPRAPITKMPVAFPGVRPAFGLKRSRCRSSVDGRWADSWASFAPTGQRIGPGTRRSNPKLRRPET